MKKRPTAFFLLLLDFAIPLFLAAQVPADISVIPDGTNQYAAYIIETRLEDPEPWINMEANRDSIVLHFNPETTVPPVIDPELISVNNVSCNALKISGRRLSILSPVDLRNFLQGEKKIRIMISERAGLKNPQRAGEYCLALQLLKADGAKFSESLPSRPYHIKKSETVCSAATVTPVPPLAGEAAALQIRFQTGRAGFLKAGVSRMMIRFAGNFKLPAGLLSGITVNGTAALATASQKTVVLTTPVDIDNQCEVFIRFSRGSGLINPDRQTAARLQIRTSSENQWISSVPFFIGSPDSLTVGYVEPNPSDVNARAAYTIEILRGSAPDLAPAPDTLSLLFMQNTGLPEQIGSGHVHLLAAGFSHPVSGVMIKNKDRADQDTMQVVIPPEISSESRLTLFIDQAAGILNPSEQGHYILAVGSTRSSRKSRSNPYLINAAKSLIGQMNVLPSRPDPGQPAAYTIAFRLGQQGRLQPGKGRIVLGFDEQYDLSGKNLDLDSSFISFADRPLIRLNPLDIEIDDQNRELNITLPDGAVNQNSEMVKLYLNGSRGPVLVNPQAAGIYRLALSTSTESQRIFSPPYTIGGQKITIDYLSLSDSTVNRPCGYSIFFQTVSALQISDADYIEVTFPKGTRLPAAIPVSQILINGVEAAGLEVLQAGPVVRVSVPQFVIPAGSRVNLQVAAGSGIINPAIPARALYCLKVHTSKDFVPSVSRTYALNGKSTAVQIDRTDIDPAITGVSNVRYRIDFRTSGQGELQGQSSGISSDIIVKFDSATVVPNYIPEQGAVINGQQAADVDVLVSGPAGIVKLTLPPGQTIENNGLVSLQFTAGAALSNGNRAGLYQIAVKTSSDTLFAEEGGRYRLGDTKSLIVNSLSVKPPGQNNMAAYALQFTTGTGGALQPGEHIHLVFPRETCLPRAISAHDISVNGKHPAALSLAHDQTLSIPVPEFIGRMSGVSLLINRESGIINPSISGPYVLGLSTDAEEEIQHSPAYTVDPARSTVSDVSFEADPPTIDMDAIYTIHFKTGAQGRLPAGKGSILLSFDPHTNLHPQSAAYDSSFIIAGERRQMIPATSINITGHKLAFFIPDSVPINNQETVTIVLCGKENRGLVRNPEVAGSYVVHVQTSVEKTPIPSLPQRITAIPPVEAISVNLFPAFSNAAAADTISFLVQKSLAAKADTITIRFPHNTLIPAEIDRKWVKIAHGEQSGVEYRSVNQVATVPSEGIVRLIVPEQVNKNERVHIAFHEMARLENPSIPGEYRLRVRTSRQETDGISTPYRIEPGKSSIVNLAVNIIPNNPGRCGRSIWRFTTGELGRLIPGKSKIGLLIPADSRFSAGLPALSKVTVNGIAAHALQLKPCTGDAPDTLLVTVPVNVTIGNNTDVSVTVDSTAGLMNASTTGQKEYAVFTSVERQAVAVQLRLAVQLSSFTAESKSGNVQLKWIAEQGLTDAYWMLERKRLSPREYQSIQDGGRTVGETGPAFETIAYLAAQEGAEAPASYTYLDSLVEIGAIYAYRLSDVDFGGAVQFHDLLYQEVKPPSDFILFRNVPNPFNRSTSIRYSLPVEANVELKIYSVTGQEIKNLVSSDQYPGFYQLEWTGTNDNGQPVASGLYVISFRARSFRSGKNFSKLMKIMLLR